MATTQSGKASGKSATTRSAGTTGGKAKGAETKGTTAKRTAQPSRERARSVAETAVDLPVGAVLEVTDRVGGLVEPFTDRASAGRQLRSYRTRLRRGVKRTERRGATARRRATTEARRTRTRWEREARKAIDDPTSRAQELVEHLPGVRSGSQRPST